MIGAGQSKGVDQLIDKSVISRLKKLLGLGHQTRTVQKTLVDRVRMWSRQWQFRKNYKNQNQCGDLGEEYLSKGLENFH